ncbi:MAG: hypothetical protein K2X47_13770, partial [Bdellovibrionales bacterium]|nr:hypothetical protein [Bdellovibrionales bacterium]
MEFVSKTSFRYGMLLAVFSGLVGCEVPINQPVVGDGGTVGEPAEALPPEPETPPLFVDPTKLICNPFSPPGNGYPENRSQGLVGELYYLQPGQPRYSSTLDYFIHGTKVDASLFLNQVFIPTRPFDRGFVTAEGMPIKTDAGDTLYEWFALRMETQVKLAQSDVEGQYQFAILSDDGAFMKIQDSNGNWVTHINNDGLHSTRLGCATQPVTMTSATKLATELLYHQGPRFHIAMILLWRPWPTNPADVNDPLCGRQGNSLYFDSTMNPPAPTSSYNALLSRGWKPLVPENYVLPARMSANPCDYLPAEQPLAISNFTIQSVTQTTMTVTW